MSSVFQDVMGSSPRMRILDYLLEGRELDVSMTDIIDGAGTGRETTYRIMEELLEHGLVIHTRTLGRSRLFMLDGSHPVVKKLIEIDDMLMERELQHRAYSQEATV